MSSSRDHAHASGDATQRHSPGPWKICGARNGRCTCGQVWSLPGDFPVFTVRDPAGGYGRLRAMWAAFRGRRYLGDAHEHFADEPTAIYASISPEQALANAHLVAAAPDLLAAVRLCIQRIERPSLSPDANVVLERAQAAISKALGGVVASQAAR